jgi:DNA transposition AAA+ family ATPase
MALSVEEKKRLLAPTDGQRRNLVARVNEYMSRTGMNALDFSARVGYSRSAINHFLNQRYFHVSGNDAAIVAAITDYMDRNPIAPRNEAQGKLYETENVRLIKHCFTRALNQRCAYYFRGAPGCQKTFVLEHLIAELNREEAIRQQRRAYLIRCRIGIRPNDLLKRVAMEVGALQTGGIDRIINNLRHHLRQTKTLLVFDEAQFLDIAGLETLRELLDIGLVGLLFAGSHQLEDTFKRLDMAQWRSRIRKGEGLPGVSDEEARLILRNELPKIADAAMSRMIGHWQIKQTRVESSGCYETDYYMGEKRGYISARLLFLAIEEVKLRQAEKGNVQ